MHDSGRLATVALTVVLGFGVAACGGAGPATAPSSGGATTTVMPVPLPEPAPVPAPVGKVSANTASEEQLVVAFEAAGVPNAEKWADEVQEYRPYPADDPNFGKLRDDLAKYHPGPGVVDKIVSALTP